MTVIKLNTNEVENLISSIKKIKIKHEDNKARSEKIIDNLDWQVGSKEDINDRLRNVIKKMKKQDELLDSYIRVLGTTSSDFEAFQKNIKKSTNEVSDKIDKVTSITNGMENLNEAETNELIRSLEHQNINDMSEMFGIAAISSTAVADDSFLSKLKFSSSMGQKYGKDDVSTENSISYNFHKGEGYFKSYEDTDTGKFLGMDQSTTVKGKFLGYETSTDLILNASPTDLGIKGQTSITEYVAKGEVEQKIGIMSKKSERVFGTTTSKVEANFEIMSKGKLDPSFKLKGEVAGSAMQFKDTSTVGSDKYNIHSSNKFDIGYASAKADAGFDRDGFVAEASAEAYLAKGEISTGTTIHGITVDIVGEGKLGGAGAGINTRTGKKGFEIGARFGVLAGLGGRIKVQW